ncbi:MAG TPA: hypothetical protein GX725_02485 [Mollicutes bacterium]|nr:hypothetical protein [Mollicutes bacterium]
MNGWKLKGGTKVFIASLGIIVVVFATKNGMKLVKNSDKANEKITADYTQELILTDDVESLSKLKDRIVNYYSNKDSKYNFTLDETLAFNAFINNHDADSLEDVYGSDIPTYDEMAKIITSFYFKASANYTFATQRSMLSDFIENEEEKKLFQSLEDTLLVVNNDELNGNLNQDNIDNAKSLLKHVFEGYYSDGLKAYAAEVIFPALEHLIGVPGFKMTDEEVAAKEKVSDNSLCDMIASYKKARDKALIINGSESIDKSIESAIAEYFNGKKTFVDYLESELDGISKYHQPTDELPMYRDRTVVKNKVKVEAKTTSSSKKKATSTSTSPKDSKNKEGKPIKYEDMTKEEKKQADKVTAEKDEILDNQNEYNERVAKDAQEVIQNYLDEVSVYVEKRVIELCNDKSVGPEYIARAIEENKRSMITQYLDMDKIKGQMIDKQVDTMLKSFDKRYTDLYAKGTERYTHRKSLYEKRIRRYLEETDFTKMEYNGKEITALTFAIMNGAQNGYSSYLMKNNTYLETIEESIKKPDAIVVVPEKDVDKAIKDIPQGQDTTVIIDEWIGYYDMEDTYTNPKESTSKVEDVDTKAQSSTNNNQYEYIYEYEIPTLDLTGTQEETVYIKK